MTLYTVSIVGVTNPVEVYIGLTAAKDYVGALVGDGADAWALLTDDARSKVLVAVTRYVDRHVWLGTANATGGTTLQWPRSNVTNPDGSAVDPTTVPSELQTAVGELCAVIADDSSVLTAIDSSTNVKSVGGSGAPSVVQNPTSVELGTATKLPTSAQALIGKWLAAAGPVAISGFSQGGRSCTDAGPRHDLGRRRWPW